MPLEGGELLVSLGNKKVRTGIVVLDAATVRGRMELTRNEDCPGVHGEAVAGDKAVAVGCHNGMLIYRGGQARPTLFVHGSTAYVTDPAASKIHTVSLGSLKVLLSAARPHVPNELTGVAG